MTENAAPAPAGATAGATTGGTNDPADPVDSVLAAPTRSPEEIQAEIDAAQQRLADQVDVLSERLAPQALAEDAVGRVKAVFVDEDGTPKPKPIAITVGTVAGLLLLRKLFHR